MTRARISLRRWTAALALVAVASLGLAVHAHATASSASRLTIETSGDPAADGHEFADCLACRSHGRDRLLPPAPAAAATLAIHAAAIPLEIIDAPVARPADSPPPTPPRGPPLPTS